MRTARFLGALAIPVIVVACAVGTAPPGEGSGEREGGAVSGSEAGYGGGGDDASTGSNDSGGGGGTKDSGVTPHDGGTVVDSGGGGTAGLDCSGGTSTSGESYDSECDDLLASGDESDCSKGGGECGAGTCCRSSTECNNFFIGDFFFPQCVPK